MTEVGRVEPVAVVGATGQQGGAVVTALLERGVEIRAVVRDPGKADALRDQGVEVVSADQDDPDSLRQAFAGASAIFVMTTMTGPDGTDGEVAHGKAMADAAAAVSAPRVVYSSVGGADRSTGIPHFESKWQVEQYLRSLGVPTTVLRPVFFMQNFASLMPPQDEDGTLVLRAPLAEGVPLQMIDVGDIGRAAATALLDPDAVPGGAVELGGDELTGEQIAQAFGDAQGKPARFERLPVEALGDDDQEAMFRWFTRLPAYQADFEVTRQLVGNPVSFADFARDQAGR